MRRLCLDPWGPPSIAQESSATLFDTSFNSKTNRESAQSIKCSPFVSVRQLSRVHSCDRMIMIHESDRTNHLLYRFDHINDPVARRRVFDRILSTAYLNHPHILKVQKVWYDTTGRLCVITDYPGNQEGLVTLGDLLEARGGKLEFAEATRLIGQLLEGCVHAAAHGVVHGPFGMDELLVDRHGCTLVELFGLQQALNNQYSVADARSEQTRSIVEIGYTLATGMPADEIASSSDASRPSKFAKRYGKQWDAWFALASDPVDGFVNAQQAIDTMPLDAAHVAKLAEIKPILPVKSGRNENLVRNTRGSAMFSRFRRSSGSR
ncbi:MAG: protein kinase [Phycisphaerales bacterium]